MKHCHIMKCSIYLHQHMELATHSELQSNSTVLLAVTSLEPSSVICVPKVVSLSLSLSLLLRLLFASISFLSPYRFLINQPHVTPRTLVSHAAPHPSVHYPHPSNPTNPRIVLPDFTIIGFPCALSHHTPTPSSCVDENVNGRDTLPLFCCDPTYQLTPIHPCPPSSIQHHQ